MSALPPPPPGFARRETGGAGLYAAPSELDALVAAGLDRGEGWPRAGGPGGGTGRGPVAVVETGAGTLFLKRMRRGGLLARFRGERFRGHHRLLANLVVPSAAIARGVPTPRVVALRLEPAGATRWRAFLASEHLAGARSLAEILREGPIEDDVLAAAMEAVRRSHDAGLVHPDLNLGNVIVRRGSSAIEAYVVDLDRARLGEGPLPFGRRVRELRRLERSYAKGFSETAPMGDDGFVAGFRAYAGGDAAMSRRLESARRSGLWTLRCRRLAWRLAGR